MNEKKDMPIKIKHKINEIFFTKKWKSVNKKKESIIWCRKVWIYAEKTILTSELKKRWAMEAEIKQRILEKHIAHQLIVTKN